MNENTLHRSTDDLGVAVYLRMHGFKVIGRKGKSFFFEVKKDEDKEYHERMFEYANSPFHDFDAQLMSLKKMPQYLDESNI